ncbi:hypothetical protein E5082_05815 [Streptomyces griseoluteus]|uniref:Uncharacterized protein n=1 Tax=Streptomyces griseoluteus TaxID=29306 RepID=A0A4Z1DMR5_STRGP|nr:hypothetical protein E5082_05815 [Streptomyces griseoluteus]
MPTSVRPPDHARPHTGQATDQTRCADLPRKPAVWHHMSLTPGTPPNFLRGAEACPHRPVRERLAQKRSSTLN